MIKVYRCLFCLNERKQTREDKKIFILNNCDCDCDCANFSGKVNIFFYVLSSSLLCCLLHVLQYWIKTIKFFFKGTFVITMIIIVFMFLILILGYWYYYCRGYLTIENYPISVEMYLNIRCVLTFILFSMVLSKHYLIETVDHNNTSTGEDNPMGRSVFRTSRIGNEQFVEK